MSVPRIGDYAYIATGAKVLGGVDVGACSIIGANSVVIDHVPPCSVVAGAPAKVLATITKDNMKKYKNNFTQFKKMSDEEVSLDPFKIRFSISIFVQMQVSFITLMKISNDQRYRRKLW